jgi:hypothetical protein
VAEDPLDRREVARALDHAWRIGPGPAWRAAAEVWPDSRMAASLEEILLQVEADAP